MPYYVKVTPQVRNKILPDCTKKPKSKDGNYLLFQGDLIGIKGNTLSERVSNVGGALLTPAECKAEREGTVDSPAHCYTPAEYGGETQGDNVSFPSLGEGQSNAFGTQTVNIPSVEAPATNDGTASNAETKKESEVCHE